MTLYGIPNCDRVRAARRWLADAGLDYRFHDVRRDGLDESLLARWLQHAPLQALINRRSTSWRSLSDAERTALEAGDMAPLLASPTLLKRPLLETDTMLLIGFDAERWQEQLT